MRRLVMVLTFVAGCAHAPPPHHVHGEGGATAPIPLPFHLIDAKSGQPLDDAAFDARLREARVLYVGEEHPNPHHHAVEIAVLERVYQIDPSLALGMEMLPKTFQPVVDRYLGGALDERAFLSAVDWEKTWGYPWGFYAPLVRFCRDHHLPLIALNAPRGLAHAVAQKGLQGLSADEKKELPEMQPGPEAHREMVREAFGAHPHGKFSDDTFERFYAAQLVWDETMATRVAEEVTQVHHMVVVAGDDHVRRYSIPDRAARRGAQPYLIIEPLFEDEVEDARKADVADVLWVFTSK
jgi:uncharacterized iron-regulated protein